MEDVSVHRRRHHPCLAKSLRDAAGSPFASLLADQAAWAGRRLVAVTPASTSQACSGGGQRQQLARAERTDPCPCCGLVLDRDLKASRNSRRTSRLQAVALDIFRMNG